MLNEYNIVATPPNRPKSTGPENIGPERTNFVIIGIGAVESAPGTTLENNEKFAPREHAENELYREVGGGTGTEVEQSLYRSW
jgi:hypothetical protein